MRDDGRVLFYHNYTSEMQRAINEDGVDVRGYFAWSLMDNFEWERGYTERFGLCACRMGAQRSRLACDVPLSRVC